MSEPWFLALWTVAAYLVGSVPFGDMVSRAAGVDIRSLGTGNPGTSNIFREIGTRYAIAVFVLDVLKGGVATLPLYLLGHPSWAGLVATSAVIGGHLFPLPWKTLGGTGVAVALGTTLGLLPLGVLVAAPVGLIVVGISRNPAYSAGTFLGVTAVAGGLLHRDVVGAAAVLLAGTAVAIKSWFQYRDR